MTRSHFRLSIRSIALQCAVVAASIGASACGTQDDQGRPGFPRTDRAPIPGSALPYASAEDAGLTADAIWRFKERLYSRVVARHVVGSEILVVVDGRIILHQAMGWADREDGRALERNSIFRLASMTKPVAGTVALMLVDDGRLDLDELVGRYLPEFATGRSGPITIRDLLTHRSGFVQGGEPDGYDAAGSLRDAVRLAAAAGPDFPAGDRFIYSGINTDVLGAVIEEVTGEQIEIALEQRAFDPLGMADTHTTFSPDSAWADRVPSSYRSWVGPWERYWNPARPHPHRWFSPAGDLFGSAQDYGLFLASWLDGGLLDPETIAEALADPESDGAANVRAAYYGMQWEIYAPPAAPGQLPIFGHRGATGTLGMVIPEHEAIVVYLTNSDENEVVDEVIDLALELFRDPPDQ